MNTETKTETGFRQDQCAFLMRIRDKMVAICDNDDGKTCTVLRCPAPGVEGKGEKEIVSRVAAWIEITAIVGSEAASLALPGVVKE